jgi:hypothetical protein
LFISQFSQIWLLKKEKKFFEHPFFFGSLLELCIEFGNFTKFFWGKKLKKKKKKH